MGGVGELSRPAQKAPTLAAIKSSIWVIGQRRSGADFEEFAFMEGREGALGGWKLFDGLGQKVRNPGFQDLWVCGFGT